MRKSTRREIWTRFKTVGREFAAMGRLLKWDLKYCVCCVKEHRWDIGWRPDEEGKKLYTCERCLHFDWRNN